MDLRRSLRSPLTRRLLTLAGAFLILTFGVGSNCDNSNQVSGPTPQQADLHATVVGPTDSHVWYASVLIDCAATQDPECITNSAGFCEVLGYPGPCNVVIEATGFKPLSTQIVLRPGVNREKFVLQFAQ